MSSVMYLLMAPVDNFNPVVTQVGHKTNPKAMDLGKILVEAKQNTLNTFIK